MQIVAYAAVIAVLLRPGSLPLLLLLASTHCILFLRDSPEHSNFLTFVFIGNVILILGALCCKLRHPGHPLRPESFILSIRPLLLLCLCAVYLFSVLHKINFDFLDPSTSYAVYWMESMKQAEFPWYLAWVPSLIPASGGFNDHLVIYWTLLVESAIPLLLLFRRTRLWGIGLDFLFHVVMAYRMYPPSTNFPAVMMAILILAFPTEAGVYLRDLRDRFVAWTGLTGKNRFRWLVSMLAVLLLAPFVLGSVGDGFHWVREGFRAWIWHLMVLLYAALFTGYVLWKRRQARPLQGEMAWRDANPIGFAVVLLVLIFNAMAPHLGLKSRASFEVFSGLNTFEGGTNHLFIPASWQMFPYLRETVTLLEAPEKSALGAQARLQYTMPVLYFTRWAAEYPDLPVTIRRGNEEIQLDRLADFPEFKEQRYSWWERKFLPMHPLPLFRMEQQREQMRRAGSEE